MKTIQLTIVLSLLALLAIPSLAEAGKCPDGFEAGNQATCYKIHSADVQYGFTKVTGEIVSLKKRSVLSLSVTLFSGDKLLCKAVGVVNQPEKNEEITFEAVCDKEVTSYTKAKFRIEAGI